MTWLADLFNEQAFEFLKEISRLEALKRVAHKKKYQEGAARHDYLPMTPIEKVRPSNNDYIRKMRESLWITKYDAVSNGKNKNRWQIWNTQCSTFEYWYY